MKTLAPPRSNGHTRTIVDLAPPLRRVPRKLLLAIGLVIILALAIGLFFALRQPAAPPLVTQPVRHGTLVQTVTASGMVNPQDTINIGSQVSGTISQLYVDYNSHVRQGQVLARLDPTSLQASLDQARASLAQSEAQAAAGQANAQGAIQTVRAAQGTQLADQAAIASAQSQVAKAQSALTLAQLTVSRDKQLLAQGYLAKSVADADASNAVAAQAALEAAKIAVQQTQAQAQAQSANAAASSAQAIGAGSSANASQAAIGIQQAQVQQAEYNLSHSIITSPVDGTVIARNVSIGQTVAASFQTPTLFSIAKDLRKMEVDVAVGEPDIGSVRKGDAVTFSVLAFPTRTFTGVVSQVRQSPTTVSNVVTYTTVVLVDNRDGALRPGMTANATIDIAKIDNATIVPVAALQWRPSKAEAGALVGANGKPFQRRSPSGSGASAPSGSGSGSGSPWGSTASSGAATVAAGSRARVFVSLGSKLRAVPVKIEMVSGTDAAVKPLRGTLSASDEVVVADATRAKGAASSGGGLLGNNASRGAHFAGGGGRGGP